MSSLLIGGAQDALRRRGRAQGDLAYYGDGRRRKDADADVSGRPAGRLRDSSAPFPYPSTPTPQTAGLKSQVPSPRSRSQAQVPSLPYRLNWPALGIGKKGKMSAERRTGCNGWPMELPLRLSTGELASHGCEQPVGLPLAPQMPGDSPLADSSSSSGYTPPSGPASSPFAERG